MNSAILRSACLSVLFLSSGLTARSASPGLEPFEVGPAGWTNTEQGNLIHRQGTLEITFEEQAIPGVERFRLVADDQASGGRFTGDWTEGNLRLFGFDFIYDTLPPSGETVQVLLHGANGASAAVFVHLDDIAPGAVQRTVVSLESPEHGGWIGPESEEDFQALLADVEEVHIRVARHSHQAHRFVIDNIFLGTPARLDSIQPTADGTPGLTARFSGLVPGLTYEIEAAESLQGPWTRIADITATTVLETFHLPPPLDTPTAFYRSRVVVE